MNAGCQLAASKRMPLRRADDESGARRDAALTILDAMRSLQRSGRNVLTALLSDLPPQTWEHYPLCDVSDRETGFSYYYHSHAIPGGRQEHGHFHLFARADGCGAPALTHLIGIGMSSTGLPVRAFTTNRWVTGEQWQPAAAVIGRLGRFHVTSPARLHVVHRWLGALLTLFGPQLRELVGERDRHCDRSLAARPRLLDDRRTYLLSQRPLNLLRELATLDRFESIRKP